jgi:lipocalin
MNMAEGFLDNPITPIPSINITEYTGLWYEIGSIPFIWSVGCTGTTVKNYIKYQN